MLNGIWVALILGAVVFGAITGHLDAVAQAITTSAAAAVTLAIGLVGVMAFFLGLMQVLQQAGLLRLMAHALRAPMRWLFPEVPADHPASGMMIMNIVSNMLGLGNAATPFGLKAMMELDRLNEHKGTASDAMITFLAVNTTGLAVLPSGIIGLRASLGSTAPASIFLTTWLSSITATAVALVMVFLLRRLPRYRIVASARVIERSAPTRDVDAEVEKAQAALHIAPEPLPRGKAIVAYTVVLAVVGALGYGLAMMALGLGGRVPLGWPGALKVAGRDWPLLLIVATFVLFGLVRGVKVYDAVVEGGKEGFQVAMRIIPFLVAMLVAVGMLRASGAIDALALLLNPLTSAVGLPAETLPMALMRPLSGSGAFGIAAEIMKTHGPDSLIGQIVSTMQGSTETTFYVLALYYGVVRVKNTRYTLPACLVADLMGLFMAGWSCRLLLT